MKARHPATATRHTHPAFWAFVVHRLSGLILALFLPAHFFVLSLAIEEAALDGFLAWTDAPLLKFTETGLVLLLAVHMAGGLRLLALEFLPWRDWQKSLIAVSGGFAMAVGLLFLLSTG